MTQHKLFQSLTQTFADCLKIVESKNHDYATEEDAFMNFRFSVLVGVDPKRAILVRMADKLARISNLLTKAPAVKDEKVGDTLSDIVNYAAILKAWLEDESV